MANILDMIFDGQKYFSQKYLLLTGLYTNIHYHVLSRPSSHILHIIKVCRPLQTHLSNFDCQNKNCFTDCMLYNYLFYKFTANILNIKFDGQKYFFSKISSPDRFIHKHTLPCIVTTIQSHPTYYQGPPASSNTFYQILIAKI